MDNPETSNDLSMAETQEKKTPDTESLQNTNANGYEDNVSRLRNLITKSKGPRNGRVQAQISIPIESLKRSHDEADLTPPSESISPVHEKGTVVQEDLSSPVEEEFPFFPKLPAELRVKIWKAESLDQPPRFVEIRMHSVRSLTIQDHNGPKKIIYGRFWTPTPTSRLLKVNVEARAEFQKVQEVIYEKAFAPAAFGTRASVGLPGSIDFNYELDVAFFKFDTECRTASSLINFLGNDDMQKIQQIAICWKPLPYFERWINLFSQFDSLKRIYLMENDEHDISLMNTSETFKGIGDFEKSKCFITEYLNSRIPNPSMRLPARLTLVPEVVLLSLPGYYSAQQLAQKEAEKERRRSKLSKTMKPRAAARLAGQMERRNGIGPSDSGDSKDLKKGKGAKELFLREVETRGWLGD